MGWPYYGTWLTGRRQKNISTREREREREREKGEVIRVNEKNIM
jgi:hypothetical protein